MPLHLQILMNVWKVKLIVSRDVGMTLEAIPATVRLGMSWKAPASVPVSCLLVLDKRSNLCTTFTSIVEFKTHVHVISRNASLNATSLTIESSVKVLYKLMHNLNCILRGGFPSPNRQLDQFISYIKLLLCNNYGMASSALHHIAPDPLPFCYCNILLCEMVLPNKCKLLILSCFVPPYRCKQ